MQSARVLVLALLLGACSAPYPHVPPAPPKKYVTAETALRRGHFGEAVVGFREFLDESEDPTYHARAYYRLAQAQYALGSYEQTLDTLAELKSEFPDQSGPQIPALQGDAHYGLGRRTDAILSWEQAWARGTKADREVLRPRLEKAIGELDPETAADLAEVVTAPGIQDMLALHEPIPLVPAGGKLARDDGGDDDERPVARKPIEVASVAETDRQPGDEPSTYLAGSPARVACLVQLTGPDKAYGWRALNGLRLAFDDVPDALEVRDTGGDPQIAAQLLRRLAADPTVLAVVGPQRSAESESIAPLAEELGIPVLLLSQREGLGGRAVLQAGITQRQQVSTVIEYATGRLGASRFAVLYPDDGYGKAFLGEFTDEVRQRNATLVGSKAYSPGDRSFEGEIAAVRDWIDSRGLQAVFIPDAAPTATALASALRQVAPELVLLGSESWNDAPLIAQAGAAIDGAVFVDTFHAASGDAATEAFVSRFRARAGTAPTVFEAQAYDAGMLVRRAIEQGAETRPGLLTQLRTVRSYEGAGRLSAAPQGFERELILLRAHQGAIERVEPAASAG
jgi:ABC-type branched-subunit amino acid transport system substrate-binding protein